MIMPDQIDPIMLAPCGINCMACYRHLSKKPCPGCLISDEGKAASCLNCAIKRCITQLGYVHCFECPQFPCKHIRTLDKSYTTRYGIGLILRGNFANEQGIASLMAQDQQLWECKDCHGIINMHDGICSECGLAQS